MYDPQIGRWLTPDPIGFDAGDANLYRYVGNQTMIAIDPFGLEETKTTQLGGKPISLQPTWLPPFTVGDPDPKAKILGTIPILRPRDLPEVPPSLKQNGFGTATGWSGTIPTGHTVGPSGCGPCVGVVLIPSSPSDPTYVLHFSAMEGISQGFRDVGFEIPPQFPNITGKAIAGFWKNGINLAAFPKLTGSVPPGYTAYVNGAEVPRGNDPAINKLRLTTLASVLSYLKSNGITVAGYIPAASFQVGRNGTVYWNYSGQVNGFLQ